MVLPKNNKKKNRYIMPIIISKLCMIFSKPFILYPSTQVNASENVSNSNRAFSQCLVTTLQNAVVFVFF